MLGEKLDRRPLEEERQRIAYHETGHALLVSSFVTGQFLLDGGSRGQALGYMRQTPDGDRYLYSRQLLDQIAIALGGAIMEEIVLR